MAHDILISVISADVLHVICARLRPQGARGAVRKLLINLCDLYSVLCHSKIQTTPALYMGGRLPQSDKGKTGTLCVLYTSPLNIRNTAELLLGWTTQATEGKRGKLHSDHSEIKFSIDTLRVQ